jgi:TPR repeat protein
MRRLVVILAASMCATAAAAATDGTVPITDCDRLAASPFDPDRPRGATGILFSTMDAQPAVTACLAAAKEKPQDARTLFQLGRALRAAKKYETARTAYRLADSFGQPLAAVDLGEMNAQGLGGSRDLAEARRLYEKSAAAGNALAMALLGNMYETGNGVQKDPTQARAWYAKAASAGIAASMKDLGVVYEHGPKRNIAAAQRWYAKAAAAGNKEAADNLQRLRTAGSK